MNRFKCQMTSDAKNQSTIRLDLNIYDLECLCLAPLQTNIEYTLVMIFQFHIVNAFWISFVCEDLLLRIWFNEYDGQK